MEAFKYSSACSEWSTYQFEVGGLWAEAVAEAEVTSRSLSITTIEIKVETIFCSESSSDRVKVDFFLFDDDDDEYDFKVLVGVQDRDWTLDARKDPRDTTSTSTTIEGDNVGAKKIISRMIIFYSAAVRAAIRRSTTALPAVEASAHGEERLHATTLLSPCLSLSLSLHRSQTIDKPMHTLNVMHSLLLLG